jgi:CHAD domain-containing protein
VVEMRALLARVTLRSRQLGLVLTDDEGKIQARVVIDQAAGLDGAPLTTVVEVVPVRGYPRAAEQVTDLLAAQVLLRPVDADPVDQALAWAGHQPGAYSSKLALDLDRDGPALEAFRVVVASLSATMAANLAGTRADTDSEFLHDFRVAVRRTRSVLGMAEGVVPDPLLRHLRAEFKWLGDVTTPTRDLDVYLLDFDQFEEAVGPSRRGDLVPLRSFLVERQRQAQRELATALDSDRYAQLVARLSGWLDDPRGEPGGSDPRRVPQANAPAPELAAERTWKVYRRLVRDGRRITPESPPTRLHDLRKDAKKLRYALECFGSLFDPDEISLGVKDLKGVQDVLGTFQDCEVQKASLASLGADLIDEGGASQASTLIAMGALVDQLDQREATARAAFAERFARFDDPEGRARFRRLFRPEHHHVAEAGSDAPGPGAGA